MERTASRLAPASGAVVSRALVATLLWGLVFVVVLTMISGARELMTPGAWQKLGWTYRLASDARNSHEPHFRNLRRQLLEQLRLALLQHAATHQGEYPAKTSDIEPSWSIPAHPGFEFLYRPGLRADSEGSQILVFEPEVGDNERLILLVNGMIGTMRTPELETALASWPAQKEETAP